MKGHAITNSEIRSAKAVAEDLGISATTLWRWRRSGWLKFVMINGRPFVLLSSLREFRERAERGEFVVMNRSENERSSLPQQSSSDTPFQNLTAISHDT